MVAWAPKKIKIKLAGTARAPAKPPNCSLLSFLVGDALAVRLPTAWRDLLERSDVAFGDSLRFPWFFFQLFPFSIAHE